MTEHTKHIFVFTPHISSYGTIIGDRAGQPCIVIGQTQTIDPTIPMTTVQFEDGFRCAAFKDELVPLDVEAQRRATET